MTTVELLARLEAESTFGDEINAWISGTRKALEAIERVRELHVQETPITEFCKECSYTYPCRTIQALDGEQ